MKDFRLDPANDTPSNSMNGEEDYETISFVYNVGAECVSCHDSPDGQM